MVNWQDTINEYIKCENELETTIKKLKDGRTKRHKRWSEYEVAGRIEAYEDLLMEKRAERKYLQRRFGL